MAMNFKDKVSEITQQQSEDKKQKNEIEKKRASKEIVNEESKVQRIRSSQEQTNNGVHGEVSNRTFSDTVIVEKITQDIKKQITEDFKQELENGLRQQIEDQVKQDLTESITANLYKKLDEAVLESNNKLLSAITGLSDKINSLSESMKVEIPTPIVHVNMPKVIKKVNRNEQGLVESVTEEYTDGSE